jgi:DNA-binding response OmpR family regulator
LNLAEILYREKIVDKNQMDEALDYQKHFGGRLETHLYRFGYADEKNLVNALAQQFAKPGLVLTGRIIPDSIIQMIPATTARQMLALPVEYNRENNHLRIACENPWDEKLCSHLQEANPEMNLELVIALSPVLKCTILHYYRQNSISDITNKGLQNESSSPSIEMPNENTAFYCSVGIINDGGNNLNTLQSVLSHQGYHVVVIDKSEIYENTGNWKNPDILIISSTGTTEEIADLLDSLIQKNIDIFTTPTILISDNLDNQTLTTFLKGGIEEVISSDCIMDLLIIRMNRIRDRLAEKRNQRGEILKGLGTHGTLNDMGVIELLQAMGSTSKTARISISGDSQQLTLFLKQGNIIYAECDTLLGPEAVYRAISWNTGVWSVDPVDESILPKPNNQLSNEALLLEGCRLMDEENRDIEFCDPDLSDIFN